MQLDVFKQSTIQQKLLMWSALALASWSSMTYELVIAQYLAMTLGGTVLRYSWTIGLYISALGLGALVCHIRPTQRPRRQLILLEICLLILGLCLPWWMVFGLHLGDLLHWTIGISGGVFYQALVYGLVLWIGGLSGAELPLFLLLEPSASPLPSAPLSASTLSAATSSHIQPYTSSTLQICLGLDYICGFLATLTFPFCIFTSLGLVSGTFLAALGNGLSACLLMLTRSRYARDTSDFSQGTILVILMACMLCGLSLYFESTLRSILSQGLTKNSLISLDALIHITH